MTTIPFVDSRHSVSRTVQLQALLLLLTTATGLVDAACYLGMGHVLVANMTGNVVFLGFAIAGASGFSIGGFLTALGAFLVGALIGGRLTLALSAQRRRWLTTAAAMETLLAAAAAIATAAGGLAATGDSHFAVIALLGLAMGIQNSTIRKLAVPDMTTTVLTLTVTGIAADSSLAGGDNPRIIRRTTAVVAMLIGALAGGALMVHVGFTATLIVTAAVFAAVTFGFAFRTEDD